jgi:Flp pilus assembly protein TadB
MLNPAWLFVSATIIAVVGILLSFKKMMSHFQTKMEEEKDIKGESFQKELTRFFIQVAIVESIPILLIIFGFMQIEVQDGPVNILFPLVIIIAVFLLALISVITIRRDILGFNNTSQDAINLVNTYVYIGLTLLSAFPIISIVALFTMAE